VTCSVTNAAGSASTTFDVTVRSAAVQISDLTGTIDGFGLSGGTQTSLDAKLSAALAALAAGDTADACTDLASLISEARAQSGKKLSVDDANQVISNVQQIRAVIGC
jgi:hypothetical protein